MPESIEKLAVALGNRLKRLEWKLVTAESCTGGRLAAAITSIPGSSDWFDRGFVTYSNLSKEEMLGVHHATLNRFGAVSEQTVIEMAHGALQRSRAQISLATTGIAGPGGGLPDKPVGTVWIGWQHVRGAEGTTVHVFPGHREHIRTLTVRTALENLIQFIDT